MQKKKRTGLRGWSYSRKPISLGSHNITQINSCFIDVIKNHRTLGKAPRCSLFVRGGKQKRTILTVVVYWLKRIRSSFRRFLKFAYKVNSYISSRKYLYVPLYPVIKFLALAYTLFSAVYPIFIYIYSILNTIVTFFIDNILDFLDKTEKVGTTKILSRLLLFPCYIYTNLVNRFLGFFLKVYPHLIALIHFIWDLLKSYFNLRF